MRMNENYQTILFEGVASQLKSKANCIGQLYGSAMSLAIAECLIESNNMIVVITPNIEASETLLNEINFFNQTNQVIEVLPDLEILPYDISPPNIDTVSKQSNILYKLARKKIDLLIVSATNLLWRLPPKEFIKNGSLELNINQYFDIDTLRNQLTSGGYKRVSMVKNPGDFSIRGSLVDLFSPSLDDPLRVDFSDDIIDSLRIFDSENQLTLRKVDQAMIIPANHYPNSSEAFDIFKENMRNSFEGNQMDWPLYNLIETDAASYGVHNYIPLFFKSMDSIWDYVEDNAHIYCMSESIESIRVHQKLIEERYESVKENDQPMMKPNDLFINSNAQIEIIKSKEPVTLQSVKFRLNKKKTIINLETLPILSQSKNDHNAYKEIIEELVAKQDLKKILISAPTENRKSMIINHIKNHSSSIGEVESWEDFLNQDAMFSITKRSISESFYIENRKIAVVGEIDLFGRTTRTRITRNRNSKDPEAILESLKDLDVGSLVVHKDHGIGKYNGLTKLIIDDVESEFLSLSYAKGDLLQVPVTLMDQVSRYIGESSDESILSNLGSDQWIKICKKTKDQAHDVAAELLDIYAKRSLVLGKSQVVDSNEYAKFCEGFEYVLTRDQSKVIEEVLDDLASSNSMDRLVCGDVGFGKTEVAMRAAFTSAINGYQVVILVPTTILAQQHYETFTERFSDWPININLMTRAQTKKSKDLLTENIRNGTADIIIGTHGVLSENIKYKNLSLVIVDEEHRFGVRQKEKLKKIKENIDYLALTATPIPRTLNMAIGELKDISMITTPPESRMPVKTYLSQWENSLIREACQREINRGGQILFVHNRIEDINNVAENIRKIIPTISIGIAHGQMKEKALEKIMMQFYSNQFDLLLATSIIESGLDIPNANTIIINKADRFGLAQLHQLRGRVGRSERQSYAYLLIPPKHKLTPQGEKRLQAIEAIEDLGVGFILATHDLEIRGAGEILGDEQSGQIQKIGFTLYKDILEQTIKTMRSDDCNQVIDNFSTDINLNIPALINEEYMPDVHLRLTMYKRISSTFDNKDLNKIKSELLDRFGNLPEYTENLIALTKMRNNAKTIGIEKIRVDKKYGRFYFNPTSTIDAQLLINLIQEKTEYKLYPDQSLGFSGDFEDTADRFKKVKSIINYLANG